MLHSQKPSEGRHADKYDSDWHDFTKEFLPKNYLIQDVDSIIRDRAGNFMFLEIKRNNADIKHFQRHTAAILHCVFSDVVKSNGGFIECKIKNTTKTRHKLRYHGYHLLQLSSNSFYNSSFILDGEPISKTDLIDFLSFKHPPNVAACCG
jgi:hypothetical protein